MIVMVTGSNGFMASRLIQALRTNDDVEIILAINRNSGAFCSYANHKDAKNKVLDIYCDLSNVGATQILMKRCPVDAIFHFAATQGKTPEAYEENVSSTLNLLRYCQDKPKFIYASSSTVYGDLALKVDKCSEEMSTVPTNLYGASKLAGEGIIHAYAEAGKIDPLILRYC